MLYNDVVTVLSSFLLYGKTGGADSASQALIKHLRQVTDNNKIVIHSLRHRLEHKPGNAGIQEYDRNLILGHSRGTMSERYGKETSRLIAAHRALETVLEKHYQYGGSQASFPGFHAEISKSRSFLSVLHPIWAKT